MINEPDVCTATLDETYQIDTHAKAALRLKLPDLLPAIEAIPDIDAAIVRRPSQVLAFLRESYCPHFAGLVAI